MLPLSPTGALPPSPRLLPPRLHAGIPGAARRGSPSPFASGAAPSPPAQAAPLGLRPGFGCWSDSPSGARRRRRAASRSDTVARAAPEAALVYARELGRGWGAGRAAWPGAERGRERVRRRPEAPAGLRLPSLPADPRPAEEEFSRRHSQLAALWLVCFGLAVQKVSHGFGDWLGLGLRVKRADRGGENKSHFEN